MTLIDSQGRYETKIESVTLKPPAPVDNSDIGKLKESIKKQCATIDDIKKYNEGLKKQIAILNEFYVQNAMEYQALADLVGVKIQETPTQSASNENESG